MCTPMCFGAFLDIASGNVEGGIYISPEFQLGQVYDGGIETDEEIILYRPVYVYVPHDKVTVQGTNNSHATPTVTAEPTSTSSQQQMEKLFNLDLQIRTGAFRGWFRWKCAEPCMRKATLEPRTQLAF